MGKTHTQYLTLGTSGSLAKKPTHGHLTQGTNRVKSHKTKGSLIGF